MLHEHRRTAARCPTSARSSVTARTARCVQTNRSLTRQPAQAQYGDLGRSSPVSAVLDGTGAVHLRPRQLFRPIAESPLAADTAHVHLARIDGSRRVDGPRSAGLVPVGYMPRLDHNPPPPSCWPGAETIGRRANSPRTHVRHRTVARPRETISPPGCRRAAVVPYSARGILYLPSTDTAGSAMAAAQNSGPRVARCRAPQRRPAAGKPTACCRHGWPCSRRGSNSCIMHHRAGQRAIRAGTRRQMQIGHRGGG